MKKIPPHFVTWFEARKKYRLTDTQIAMARALGLNPKNFGGIANHRQELWKVPLPQFIESIYAKKFDGKPIENVKSLEEIIAQQAKRKALRREMKKQSKTEMPEGERVNESG